MPPTPREPLLQGTLDLLILRALAAGPRHGHAIAKWIQAASDDVLLVPEGSLYPALHRLEAKGWLAAEWGVSENNRQARHYALTRAGRKQLELEGAAWARLSSAIERVLNAPEAAT